MERFPLCNHSVTFCKAIPKTGLGIFRGRWAGQGYAALRNRCDRAITGTMGYCVHLRRIEEPGWE